MKLTYDKETGSVVDAGKAAPSGAPQEAAGDDLLSRIEAKHESDLTKEEMSMAIDRFKKWGAENGIYLPNPGDEALLREIEIEMGRNRAYLGG